MKVTRRQFVSGTAALGLSALTIGPRHRQPFHSESFLPRTFSVTPVVGDGQFILQDPPEDPQGYFRPRDFEVTVGMEITAAGDSTNLVATTVAPSAFPEQEILEQEIQTDGCVAEILQLSETAAQLALSAGSVRAGQTVTAMARYKMRISMVYPGYSQEFFPADQAAIRNTFDKKFLRNSTGIKTNTKRVRDLAEELVPEKMHAWDAAKIFNRWVWENIEGVPGRYTSVDEAIKKRTGDCEERAAVFIALCRRIGIPARLVWVPGHNWAEFGMVDHEGTPHWIPVHTAAYNWFGWTGAHELVMQKGDNVLIPHRKRKLRLIDDWYRVQGPRPKLTYSASIKPLPAEDAEDAGPGERIKRPNGVWELAGEHPDNQYMRNQ